MMEEKNLNLLKETFPKEWFEDLRWGIECSDGWFDLIVELLEKIEPFVKDNKDFRIHQIKEKMGGLRIYCGPAPMEVFRLTGEYERKSFEVCELCGQPGQLRDSTSWLRTLCDKCEEERIVYAKKENS